MSTFKFAVCICTLVFSSALVAGQQRPMSSFDRDRAQGILQVISNDVKKHYYDPKFHGLDWDNKVAETKRKMAEETSFNMSMAHIAALLDSLNDSHTFLLPPQHAYRLDHGFQYQMIGNRCFITQIKPHSDAEVQGLKPGDQILTINGYDVAREYLWKMQYAFNILRPQATLHLGIQDLSGTHRDLAVAAKIRQGKVLVDVTGGGGAQDIWDIVRDEETQEHLLRPRYLEVGDKLLVVKVPEFMLSADDTDRIISKARKYPNLIFDLRGNPGGAVESLKYLIGGVFDKQIKIADRVGRKETKPEYSKPMHDNFSGKLIVLVDARSASAAEIFARIIQLEKRGIVVGDLSSGSVMEAKHYDERMGADTVIFYGASITEYDLIMTDGRSLEHRGVTPDEVVLPTAADLALGKDPALARAAKNMGVSLTPEQAGKAFPYEWPPE